MVILKLGSGKREIKMIMSEFGMGLEQEQIMNMYEYATDTKFVPLLVDMNTADKYKKFRKGFLEILDPDVFVE
jgi:hypothetical protein